MPAPCGLVRRFCDTTPAMTITFTALYPAWYHKIRHARRRRWRGPQASFSLYIVPVLDKLELRKKLKSTDIGLARATTVLLTRTATGTRRDSLLGGESVSSRILGYVCY
jgi:hypothetical protein